MKEQKNKFHTHLTLLASAIALAACGGGGGDAGSSGPSAEGVYGGTLTGSTSSAFQLLVLENGEFWAMYGIRTSNAFGVAGFLQGSGVSNNGSFTSSNTKDFGFVPAVSGTTNASYNATAKTISGTVTSAAGTVGFSGGPIAGSLYNYDTGALLTTVSGTWSTTSLTGETVSINIASTGTFTAATSLGCGFSGTVTPRSSGKNVFNVALTFGAAPCALPGQVASGIAVAYPLATGQTQLLVAVTDSSRTVGTAVFGVR
jgi:hypothetical protein